jgi:hypothetical protein
MEGKKAKSSERPSVSEILFEAAQSIETHTIVERNRQRGKARPASDQGKLPSALRGCLTLQNVARGGRLPSQQKKDVAKTQQK